VNILYLRWVKLAHIAVVVEAGLELFREGDAVVLEFPAARSRFDRIFQVFELCFLKLCSILFLEFFGGLEERVLASDLKLFVTDDLRLKIRLIDVVKVGQAVAITLHGILVSYYR
jgi:hypothetical protein